MTNCFNKWDKTNEKNCNSEKTTRTNEVWENMQSSSSPQLTLFWMTAKGDEIGQRKKRKKIIFNYEQGYFVLYKFWLIPWFCLILFTTSAPDSLILNLFA